MREIRWSVDSHTPPTRAWPVTQVCPDWESNQRSFGSQAGTQSTEPHQLGQKRHFGCSHFKPKIPLWLISTAWLSNSTILPKLTTYMYKNIKLLIMLLSSILSTDSAHCYIISYGLSTPPGMFFSSSLPIHHKLLFSYHPQHSYSLTAF